VALLAFVFCLMGVPHPCHGGDHKQSDHATSHRRFDDVEYWKGVFDDPARAEWQKPEELVGALSIKPGMRVADIGAGTGYFSRSLSAAVGEHGSVFAVEVEPNLVAHLRARAEKDNIRNVIPVLASVNNPRLPVGAIDLVLFVDTYHHLDGRTRYLDLLKRSLTPRGRVAIVEWKPGPLPVGPQEETHKLSRERLVAELAGAGFDLVGAPDFLPYQNFFIFGRRP
jgi:ubiquinone/menaquinone biosynthesis C-methylase UbiE